MIRAPLGDKAYWDKWVKYSFERIEFMILDCKTPAGNPQYLPQYVFELTQNYWHLIFRRYSRGDTISELAQYFAPMLDAWEESVRLGQDVFTPEQQRSRNDWSINLDHYIVCFWLVGLALALEIPDTQWLRLLALIGNEGEDELLDRVIASRQSSRKIGTKLCHPKPYQRLLDTIDAPSDEQAKLLFTFVDKWYAELNRVPKKGSSEKSAMYLRPYWYTYGDRNLEGGAYFGRWCVEAVAAVKAFGLDDGLCLGHPNYPGDLLRPDGPATHPQQVVMIEQKLSASSAQQQTKSSWFTRLFGRK
jgi:hypothetical protein